MRIFIDCDDTLVLWTRPDLEEDVPRPNIRLIEALQGMNGAAEIIVWTTEDVIPPRPDPTPNSYAYSWGEKYLAYFGVHYSMAIDKNFSMLSAGDIAVDDTTITGYAGSWMTANEFITFARDWRKEWDDSHKHADHGGG